MFQNNFTHKSQEAIQTAHNLAIENGQNALEPIHLLFTLIVQEQGVVAAILHKISVNVDELKNEIEGVLDSLPRNQFNAPEGPIGQIYLSQAIAKVFSAANKVAKSFKD